MRRIHVIGIGVGDPDFVTGQAVAVSVVSPSPM